MSSRWAEAKLLSDIEISNIRSAYILTGGTAYGMVGRLLGHIGAREEQIDAFRREMRSAVVRSKLPRKQVNELLTLLKNL